MPATVLAPTTAQLIEICAFRRNRPPRWTMDTRFRCDRVRAAINNSGLALPTGEMNVSLGGSLGPHSEALDLPAAIAAHLADPAHKYLRRRGWIAWGALQLDASIAPTEESLVNDLPFGPCIGRVWAPDDHIPGPDESAVMSLVDVSDLAQAWDVIVFLASVEEVIMDDRRNLDPRSFC